MAGGAHAARIQHVTTNDLDLIGPGDVAELVRIAHETADSMTICQQTRHESTTDVPRGTGYQAQHVDMMTRKNGSRIPFHVDGNQRVPAEPERISS
ncbi:hypothetical protein GCM10027444_07280 [Actinopolyspora lacussalsi]